MFGNMLAQNVFFSWQFLGNKALSWKSNYGKLFFFLSGNCEISAAFTILLKSAKYYTLFVTVFCLIPGS